MVGFGDVRFAALLSVPSTTMPHQPCRAGDLDRIEGPAMPSRGLAVSPSLVIRESCGAYRPRVETRQGE
jgi:LacI family transcriptional regulator